jgi:tetratricopeptide (TPR) repeat protein
LFSSILKDAPSPMPNGTPIALVSVIERCLEKDSRRRYQRAGEVAAALEAIRGSWPHGGLPDARGRGDARREHESLETGESNVAGVFAVPRRFSRVFVVSGVAALTLAAAGGTWLGVKRYSDAGTSTTEPRLSDGNRASPNAEANAYYERALLFGGTGTANPDQAERMVERALAMDASFAAARAEYAFYQVARILNGMSNDAGLFHKAESEARRALNDDPRCGRAHSVLALVYLLQGRKESVPGEVEQALKDNPADPTALGWSLQYHQLNGDYDQALEQVDRLVRQWPLYWPAHLNKGKLLRERGDLDGAIREQERVLEQDPQNVYSLASLARAYIDAADLQKARQTLERARKENRQNYTLRQTWALLLALEGKKTEAAQEMDSGLQAYAAIQIFGPSSAASFLRGHGRGRNGAGLVGPRGAAGRLSRGVPATEPVAEGPSRASAVPADSGLRRLPPPATRVLDCRRITRFAGR